MPAAKKKASKAPAKPAAKGKKAAKTAAARKPSKRPATGRKGGKCGSAPAKGKKTPLRAVKRKQTATPRPRKPAAPVRRDVTVKLRWPHDWHCPSPNAVLVVSPCGTKCTVTAEPGRYELHAVRTRDGFICDPVEASVVTVIVTPPPKEAQRPQAPAPIPVADRAVQSPDRAEFKWYVLSCVPGEEAKVKGRLGKHLALQGLKPFVKKVLNARRRVMLHDADGKPYFKSDKTLPGYLLLHMHFTPDLDKLIQKTYGALRLLMPKPKPKGRVPTPGEVVDLEMWQPASVETEDLANVFLEDMLRKDQTPKAATVPFEVGDDVIVTAGLLVQARGRVVRIDRTDEGSPSVEILTTLLGREVRHTVKYFQCRKA